MTDEEQEDQYAIEFVKLAEKATREARQAALNSGHPVVEMRHDGRLIKVHPDGREEFIKQCTPLFRVEAGRVYHLK